MYHLPGHRLRTVMVSLATLAMLATVTAGGMVHPAYALANCDVADLTFDSEEQAFLSLINQYRAQNGAGPLTESVNLHRAASWMAVDLATRNYFSHTDSLGRSPSQRAIDCGSPQGAGENIAAGTFQDTAQEIFDQWKASPGHNQNMLYGAYRQIGIARYYNPSSTYKWYWVTDFSLTDDGTRLGGGGGAGTPLPTATSVPSAKAVITSPQPGSTLPGASTTFSWTSGSGALEYFFYAGTAPGSNNLYAASTGTNLSVTVSNLPTNGSTIYVRLWTRFSAGWQFNDYTYTAATLGSTATLTPTATSPTSTPVASATPTLTNTSIVIATRTPTNTAAATATPTRTGTATSISTATATPVPTSTRTPTSTAGSVPARAAMIAPPDGSTLPGTTVTFQWTAGNSAAEYFLSIGTSRGASDIYNRTAGLALSATVTNLPQGGGNVYVRLWTRSAARGWQYNDYVYQAAP